MRDCNGCTKCCEGWLDGVAHGKDFWPGRPCHFKIKGGCEIYDKRPDDPCKSYTCAWKSDEIIPAWMKPDECNVIVSNKSKHGVAYLEFTEAGGRMDPRILSWILMSRARDEINNVRWQLDGGWNYIGSREFIAVLSLQNQPVDQ